MCIKLYLFGLVFLALVNSSCSLTPINGIYLIRKGYTGDVIILFNQPDGVIPEVENGFYVYKIPEDGILKVKISGKTSNVNKSYFYIDEDNKRQRIEYLRVTGDRNPAGEPQNKFGNINQHEYENTVFVMNAGGLGSFNTKHGIIQFTSFIIGTPKDSERLYDKMQERISNLHRKFIQNS
jgi:hypothetical protein